MRSDSRLVHTLLLVFVFMALFRLGPLSLRYGTIFARPVFTKTSIRVPLSLAVVVQDDLAYLNTIAEREAERLCYR